MKNKKKTIMKKTQKLPDNYNEILLQLEIDLEKGNINQDLIRKLLYSYSVNKYRSKNILT